MTPTKMEDYSHPVLVNESNSFLDGVYEPSIIDLDSSGLVTVKHSLKSAPLITKMLANKTAKFGCSVDQPSIAMHNFYLSTGTDQKVELKDMQAVELAPFIVAIQDIEHQLVDEDGVSPNWIGKVVQIKKGSKLGIGNQFNLSSYKTPSETEYFKLQKKLIAEKNSALQQEFVDITDNSREFTKWIRAIPGIPTPIIKDSLTAEEFVNPSAETEIKLYETWSNFSYEFTCSEDFWAEVTLNQIEAGRIESRYLKKSSQTRDLDFTVRTILRQLSGLFPARGRVSVYVNCPFARAWWRVHLAKLISEKTRANFKTLHSMFRSTQENWEHLISCLLKNNILIGETQARDELVCLLFDKYQKDSKSDLFTRKNSESIRNYLYRVSKQYEFNLMKENDLAHIIMRAIDSK